MKGEKLNEGWQAEKYYTQRVYHYIDTDTVSLCGGLGLYMGGLMEWKDEPVRRDDCKECYRRAKSRHAKAKEIK